MDLQLIRGKLQEFGLERTNGLFVSLAERVCGLDFSDPLFNRLPEVECTRILEYILTYKHRVIPKHFVPRFVYKNPRRQQLEIPPPLHHDARTRLENFEYYEMVILF